MKMMINVRKIKYARGIKREMSSLITLDCKEKQLRDISPKIKEHVASGKKIKLVNASHIFGLASGLKSGEITIEGDIGDWLGMLNHGSRITVNGNAGDYAGDNAWDGEILIKGNAGNAIGLYAYGGALVVHGNVGNGVGQMLKGGTIVVSGNVGDEVGMYMVGGKIIIGGNAGKDLGQTMIRGAIYIAGEPVSLGANTKFEKISKEDIDYIASISKKYGINFKSNEFKKIVPLAERPFY